jgi:hypothetical protein
MFSSTGYKLYEREIYKYELRANKKHKISGFFDNQEILK